MAANSLSGTFSASGQTSAATGILYPEGVSSPDGAATFNIWLSGGAGTVELEATPDGGTTWFKLYSEGTQLAVMSASATVNKKFVWDEAENGVGYRLNCTAYSSGPIAWKLSQ